MSDLEVIVIESPAPQLVAVDRDSFVLIEEPESEHILIEQDMAVVVPEQVTNIITVGETGPPGTPGASNAIGPPGMDGQEGEDTFGFIGAPSGHGHRADEITLTRIGDATYDQLQEIHDLTRSAGHLNGGVITAVGTSIAVTAGQGFIRAVDDDTSTLYTFDWPAPANIPIPTDSIRYVRVNYNSGSPIVTVSASEDYDYRTAFPLGFVVNEADTLYINDTPHSVGRAAGRMIRRAYEVDGRTRAHQLGGLIIGETGTRNVQVTQGVTWLRGIRETFAAFDSSGADRFDRYYRGAVPGTWVREPDAAQYPNTTYDDGSGVLALLGNNRFGVYWFYLGSANGIIMVYGRGNYVQLQQAQLEQVPGDLPLRLQVGAILLGRIIIKKDDAVASAIDSAFVLQFGTAQVTDHGSLAGLADDDHPQYHTDARGDLRYLKRGDALPFGLDGQDGEDGFGVPGERGADGREGLTIPGLDGEPGEDAILIPGVKGDTVAGPPGPPGMDGEGEGSGEGSLVGIPTPSPVRWPIVYPAVDTGETMTIPAGYQFICVSRFSALGTGHVVNLGRMAVL